ncbi:hypothetical protein [Streptomyces goshikiensis]|uniref:MmyB family transcriptional regulator n=1 Tax=Streptomyces goshikiensis TaxID=1942 RepID=UPI00365100DC
MDRSSEICEFLRTRRARITPEQARLAPPRRAPPRSGPALRGSRPARRSSPESASTATSAWNEAAPRASPKPSWTPSPAACTWTTPNAPTSSTSPGPPPLPGPAADDPSPRNESAPALYRALDALSVPAVVQGRRLEVLAANPLGCALFADFASRPHRDRNFARFVFLDQAALSLSTDWERVARDTAASLRLYADATPTTRSSPS